VSQPTPEMIGAVYDAFNRGDHETWIATLSEDCEFHDLNETPDTGVSTATPGRAPGWPSCKKPGAKGSSSNRRATWKATA
jgi:hypothetical protein